MAILCLGDSLTYGSYGYSYIPFLGGNIKVYNRGVNGDTIAGAFKRAKGYVADKRYLDADTYVVSIGTNDCLLPFLSELSPLWAAQMRLRIKWQKCCVSQAQFARGYETLIDFLIKNGKRVIVIGLPYIQIEGFPTSGLILRNRMIKEMSARKGVNYVDAYQIQCRIAGSGENSHSWGCCGMARVFDGALMRLFPGTKDWLSRKRRLSLTVDGCHYNSASAKAIGEAVLAYLFNGSDTA